MFMLPYIIYRGISIRITFNIKYIRFRPGGKESTEVQITQNKGKERENSYQKLKRSRRKGTCKHT
jgi:hypothetical protein